MNQLFIKAVSLFPRCKQFTDNTNKIDAKWFNGIIFDVISHEIFVKMKHVKAINEHEWTDVFTEIKYNNNTKFHKIKLDFIIPNWATMNQLLVMVTKISIDLNMII